MANTWYTDVAALQIQGNNYPGQVGQLLLTTIPGSQNNPLFEGAALEIVATYTWTGSEAANDTINIAILPAGVVVDPNGHVSSGTTAPATTLTVAIGDNDLGSATSLPIPNAAAFLAQPTNFVAPTWVTGTVYALGNVVIDTASTPANLTYTCISALTSSTAPHSDSTHWMPNYQRYSGSIDIHAASGNVAFSGGTQNYGGPASIVPYSTTPGSSISSAYPTVTSGPAPALWAANQQYQIQNDCWLQALILTATTVVANTVSVFRIPVLTSN